MTPRTRVIIVTNPHNPSGVVADPAALEEIGAIARAHGAYVLVDEVYLDLAVAAAPTRHTPRVRSRRAAIHSSARTA